MILNEGAGRKKAPIIGSQGMAGGRSDVGISMQQGVQPKSSGILSYQHSSNSQNQVIYVMKLQINGTKIYQTKCHKIIVLAQVVPTMTNFV